MVSFKCVPILLLVSGVLAEEHSISGRDKNRSGGVRARALKSKKEFMAVSVEEVVSDPVGAVEDRADDPSSIPGGGMGIPIGNPGIPITTSSPTSAPTAMSATTTPVTSVPVTAGPTQIPTTNPTATPTANPTQQSQGTGQNFQYSVGNGIKFSDGKTVTFGGLFEYIPCIDFETSSVQQKFSSSLGDALCVSNQCGGCCRMFDSYLKCDVENEYSSTQCVCNSNTFIHKTVTSPSDSTGDENSGGGITVDLPDDVSEVVDALEGDAVEYGGDIAQVLAVFDQLLADNSTFASIVNMANVTMGGGDDEPIEDRTGNTGGGGITIQIPDAVATPAPEMADDGCLAQFSGRELGIPPVTTDHLPSGLEPGDCTETSHCQPAGVKGSVCCK